MDHPAFFAAHQILLSRFYQGMIRITAARGTEDLICNHKGIMDLAGI
jgi:hypothetical protein